MLLNMNEEFGDQVTLEYNFWSAMIKWREGKVQAAINLLSSLNNAKINNNDRNPFDKSGPFPNRKCHFS